MGIPCLEQYRKEWDEKRERWKDQPLENWACFTGDTKVLTRTGMYQIMDLPKTGEVLTLCGWKQYKNPRITRQNAQLVEVVFADGLTVKCTPDHMFLVENGWRSAKSLKKGTLIQSSLIQSPLNANQPRVASVNNLTETQDVWCLTVPEVGHFSLENGAIVHNCHGSDAFRTMANLHKFKGMVDQIKDSLVREAREAFKVAPQEAVNVRYRGKVRGISGNRVERLRSKGIV